MAAARPQRRSMQQIIEDRRRASFIGRTVELDVFRGNFDLPPEDVRHRFVFHVRGNAGVGKTSLVREMARVAQECGAVTVHADESADSVPALLAALSEQFGRQGHPLKALDRLLATYRQRLQEALTTGSQDPSAGSLALARAGLIGAGMIPLLGAFAGAVDPALVARGADGVRSALGTRFGRGGDAGASTDPVWALTGAFLDDLARVGEEAPWIAIFLDTYERTAPYLDGWLHELITRTHRAALPDNVVFTLAGQRRLDPAHWDGAENFVTDLPLRPFTDTEARGLLAAKGITDEPVVAEVLRLSGRLPVLVSTLAGSRPTAPDEVDDPSATAVERFLKWERDPALRTAALACALPRRLDEDITGAALGSGTGAALGLTGAALGTGAGAAPGLAGAVPGSGAALGLAGAALGSTADVPDAGVALGPAADVSGTRAALGAAGVAPGYAADAPDVYVWLCSLPFVTASPGRARYHEVVRAPMLRLRRAGAPQAWRDGHARLAALFAARRTAEEDGHGDAAGRPWSRLAWRTERGEELYHLLCSAPRTALPAALRDGVDACWADTPAARRWARALAEAGEDGGDERLRSWGAECLAALADEQYGAIRVLGLLLARPELDDNGRAAAYNARGWQHFSLGRYQDALDDHARAADADPQDSGGHHGAAITRRALGEFDAALRHIDRCAELAPEAAWVSHERGETYRRMGRYEEALAELDRAHALAPKEPLTLGSRGQVAFALGRAADALEDLDRAVVLWPDYTWALTRRAHVRRFLGDGAGALADLDRAERLSPGTAGIMGERGDVYRFGGRYEEAVAEYGRALAADPAYAWALGSRALAYEALGRTSEALADLDRALEIDPAYAWARAQRDRLGGAGPAGGA
ncbi:tetratricopeptide repeat protein [Streptomyces sp. NPDC059118]|uniref:tetratricopeptide repeat protein n=1 Tax=unclassified Streptomyces TaxID=2593676 RepID=UPI0036913203